MSEFELKLNPKATFECGQCFRWNPDENGVYTGVAFGRVARVSEKDGAAVIECPQDDFDAIWRGYFDADTDYGAIARHVAINEHMERAAQFGAGIRILRQERWEALCSFIVSQCNNIPRIKKIIETLCAHFGEEIADGVFSFPSAERLAQLEETDLAPLRSGYRAKYIVNAARAVAGGAEFNSVAQLKTLTGVGEKVACCAALFGLHDLDAFPVDTWMKKALANHFGAGFDHKIFSPYSGVAQQYLFYYERENS
ncbi:MAG: DNA-3-methyladenine glycosylase 2 family protein [Oscillospiraceae bacterium]|jgi:N-glycosylase/DNA lyase|nr:DNA-3-methyladenine glycosylase 2 family protein [Oscillospiraceae bacterium]